MARLSVCSPGMYSNFHSILVTTTVRGREGKKDALENYTRFEDDYLGRGAKRSSLLCFIMKEARNKTRLHTNANNTLLYKRERQKKRG